MTASKLLPLSILLLMAALLSALVTATSAHRVLAPLATPGPGEVCSVIFETDFPFGDPKTIHQLPDTSDVTVGGEDYTSVARGNPGVRLRDFRDSLLPGTRPGGSNYGDQWMMASGGSFSQWSDGNGVILGGTGTLDGWPDQRHPNFLNMVHTLPAGAGLYDDFEFGFEMRVDEADNTGNTRPNGVAGQGHLGGVASNGHGIYFADGFARGWNRQGAASSYISATVVDNDAPSLLQGWTLSSQTDYAYHSYRITNYGGYVTGWYDGHSAAGYDLRQVVSRLTHISLHATAWRPGGRSVIHFKDVSLDWIKLGQVTSIAVTLPPGYTRYGLFNAETNAYGTITYYLVDVSGEHEIHPDDDLGAIATGPFRLRAVLQRGSGIDPSPRLISWSVMGCRPTTPTPTVPPSRTPTGTPRTPTPTVTPWPSNTPRPSSTPRPTITPGAYFQMTPLRGYVHLRVSPLLDPPPFPYDETDWQEDEPMFYQFQVYAGLVPSAFVDPSVGPPRLCYWDLDGWVCIHGQVRLESYRLTGILHENINFLEGPHEQRSVPYAYPHKFGHWDQTGFRYVASEYTWVNWLAPGGVIPSCQSGIRCITLENMVPGPYDLVWDVNGQVHWDAIPGVIPDYDYYFTQTFRAPISLVYARAEP
jgi:hypothetical protein